MSSNWTKPTDLSFPLTARGLEDINSMFQKLFSKFPLSPSRGGTGLTAENITVGSLFYGDVDALADPIISTLASVSPGSYLRSEGVLTAPLWSTLKLPNTAAVGDILIASTLDTITGLAIGAAGTVIRSNGTIPANTSFTIPNTFAQGDLVYASASNVLTALAKDTNATRYLSNTGTSNAPAWAQVTLSNGVSGVLGVTSGGTGLNSVTTGMILYATGTNVIAGLAIGANGAFVRSTSVLPIWSSLTLPNSGTAGGILHTSATDTGTFLAIGAAGKVLRSTGTLPAWSSFTIPDTVAQGDLLYGSASNVLAALADVAVGSVLASGGVGAAPVWSAAPTITTSVTTPLVIGGTAVGSSLTLQSTSGVGSSDFIKFLVGNNGATEAMRILTSGFVGIGTTNPANTFVITKPGSNAGAEYNIASSVTISAFNRTTGLYTNYTIDALAQIYRFFATSSSEVTYRALGALTLAGATTGINLDLVTNITPGALSITGQLISLPTVTVANTNVYKGYSVTQAALTNSAGTTTWAGVDVQMPAITQSGGTLTSTGVKITGGTVTSGTAYALITDTTAGAVGLGVAAPTAVIHLRAGTATASTAPLKFNSGTLLTTAEAGAIEFLTDAFYATITTGAARKTFAFLESPSFTTPALGAATATSLVATGTVNTALVSLPNTGGAATSGNAVLVLGTVTVNTTAATATCLVFAQRKTAGGTIGFASTYTINAGVSFTLTSDSALDTSTYSWWIVETH